MILGLLSGGLGRQIWPAYPAICEGTVNNIRVSGAPSPEELRSHWQTSLGCPRGWTVPLLSYVEVHVNSFTVSLLSLCYNLLSEQVGWKGALLVVYWWWAEGNFGVIFLAAAFLLGKSHCHYPTWCLGPGKQDHVCLLGRDHVSRHSWLRVQKNRVMEFTLQTPGTIWG